MKNRALWKCKHRLMNGLSRLPFNERIHFLGQRVLGKHALDAEEMFGRAIELFLLLRRAGGDVRGKAVLEIGTGWFPFTAVLAHLFGAEQVVTVDIHPWLKRKNALLTLEHAYRLASDVVDQVGVSRQEIAKRYGAFKGAACAANSVEELLAAANIRYMAKTDLLQADIPAESMDVVFSSNVLEHIPCATLEAIHAKTAELTRHGGYAVHRFNPDDHYKNLSGSSVSFLEYEERAWRGLGGFGLAFHNRMRTAEHSTLIRQSPWTLVFWAEAVDRKATRDIECGRIVPAGRFVGMSAESLAAWYAWVVMRKGVGTTVAGPERVGWIRDLL